MITVQYLDIRGDQLPADKSYGFGNAQYLMRFRKNVIAAKPIYTVEVFTADGRTFLYSNKLTYSQVVMDSILAPFLNKIIPLNPDRLSSGKGIAELNDDTIGKDILFCTGIQENA